MATERTTQGEQILVAGVKPITDADRLRQLAAKPMAGGNKPAGGLFDDNARAQADIFDARPVQCNEYLPLLRPASFSTLPDGVTWEYVKAPSMPGLANRPDLPRSDNRYGVIRTSRTLTTEEGAHFDLRPL